MHKNINPKEYANLPRDSKQDIEVLRWLRQQNDTEKFKFIWNVYRLTPKLGLTLVKKSQLKPIYLEVILENGFVYGDASSIKWWLEVTIEGLGHKKVIAMVKNHLEDAPLSVYKVLYWLPNLINNCPAALDEIANIKKEFESLYPSFSSSRSVGIHATNAYRDRDGHR